MFSNLKKLMKDLKIATEVLQNENAKADKLYKQNKQLLSKIESAEKRGGVLLQTDLTEELIQKLQSLTDDNVVVLFLQNDGTRIEIRKQGTTYKETTEEYSNGVQKL